MGACATGGPKPRYQRHDDDSFRARPIYDHRGQLVGYEEMPARDSLGGWENVNSRPGGAPRPLPGQPGGPPLPPELRNLPPGTQIIYVQPGAHPPPGARPPGVPPGAQPVYVQQTYVIRINML